MFTKEESKFVAIFCQTLLYGAYVVLFIITHWVLVYQRPNGQPVNWTMTVISMTMFTLATMHVAINFTRMIRAFVDLKDEPGGPAAFFDELAEFTQLFGSSIYIVQTLIGDGVVLLRCYLVWGRRFSAIAFPALLLLGSTASGIGILYSMAHVVPHAVIFADQLQRWILTFFSMTLATNIICTSMVAFRIWYINRQNEFFQGGSLRPVMLLVVESGAVYSATLLALLILYKAESWFQYVLLDAVSPIVGLVFSMIIIRIGLGITSPSGETRMAFASRVNGSGTIRGDKDHGTSKLEFAVATGPPLSTYKSPSQPSLLRPHMDDMYLSPGDSSIADPFCAAPRGSIIVDSTK